jgi:RNA polymerase sigma-70 factor (family 1)
MEKNNPDIAALLYSVSVNNDESSYRRLFEIFFPSLKRFACCLLRSAELAEEAASDTMIVVWEQRQRLTEIENIRVWLFVVIRNKCLNILKQQQARTTLSLDDIRVEVSFPGSDPEQICINSEIRKKMEKAINSLPPRCKLIFKLIKEEGLSYKEVAVILDISPKTVDAQLVTALRKLTQAIRIEYSV